MEACPVRAADEVRDFDGSRSGVRPGPITPADGRVLRSSAIGSDRGGSAALLSCNASR